MAKVIDLKSFKQKKRDFVYECDCGSQLFYLNASFDPKELLLECRSCNCFVDNFKVENKNGKDEPTTK